jgi:small subunit ribosomal protein S6
MTFIVRPDLDEDQTRGVVDVVTGRLESAGAEMLATVPWNPPRRRMAYPIHDFGDGFYVTTVFNIDSQALRPVETQLRLNENLLRFLIVQATEQNIKQAQQRMQQAARPREAQPEPPSADEAPAPAPQSATEPARPAEEQTTEAREPVPVATAAGEPETTPEDTA